MNQVNKERLYEGMNDIFRDKRTPIQKQIDDSDLSKIYDSMERKK